MSRRLVCLDLFSIQCLNIVMKDQTHAVYEFERALFDHLYGDNSKVIGTMTLMECQRYIDMVWAHHKYGEPPQVKELHGDFANGNRNEIGLPIWACNPFIILHELAHSMNVDVVESHGPNFMRLLLDLRSRYLGCELVWCDPFARSFGLNISDQILVPVTRDIPRLPRLRW